MNKWNSGVWMCLMLLRSVAQGGEDEKALSMRMSVKEACLVQLPVVCRVTIKNEGAQELDVPVPSGYDQSLASAVRKAGASGFEKTVLWSKFFSTRRETRLMPGQEIQGWINLWGMLGQDLAVGEYECVVQYRYGAGPNDAILCTNKFRVVEPTKLEDRRAHERFMKIKTLLDRKETNATDKAVKLLAEFAQSPEAVSSGYLARSRQLTEGRLVNEGKHAECVKQLEELRRYPPEWMSVEEIVIPLGRRCIAAAQYDKAISVIAELAERNREARTVLNDAKRLRDELGQ